MSRRHTLSGDCLPGRGNGQGASALRKVVVLGNQGSAWVSMPRGMARQRAARDGVRGWWGRGGLLPTESSRPGESSVTQSKSVAKSSQLSKRLPSSYLILTEFWPLSYGSHLEFIIPGTPVLSTVLHYKEQPHIHTHTPHWTPLCTQVSYCVISTSSLLPTPLSL